MAINFGNSEIDKIFYGSSQIDKVYKGSQLIYELSGSKPSYAILTNNTRIDFEIENTPIANLCTSSSSIVINSVSYTKNTIKEIHFGSSYSGVTEIGKYFLRGCSSLINLTLDFPVLSSIGDAFLRGCSSLINLTLDFPVLNSVGDNFAYYCSSLINLTLDFPVLNSVGSSFLLNCGSLTNLTLTTETPPKVVNRNFLTNTSMRLSIYVPSASVNAYKRASPWSNHSSKISAIPVI